MDAFYASVEMRDNPSLRNKALIIGHDPRLNNGHGVVATANYHARKYGVHSAMSTMKALKLVPESEIVFVNPDFEKYHAVSDEVHKLMHELTDTVESVALDEAYLDVTNNKLNSNSALELATELQEKIYKTSGLTSSFGVSYNKYLAKMGSEYAKPFGRTLILPNDAISFLSKHKIEDFPGIGKKTQEKLHEMGVFTGEDLQKLDVNFLITEFKKMGYYMAQHIHGIDLSPVQADRPRKSIGIERTFEPNIFDQNRILTILRSYSNNLAQKLEERNLSAENITIKLRNSKFETITRSRKLDRPSQDPIEFFQSAKELLNGSEDFLDDGIRLIGLSVGDLQDSGYEEISLELF